MKIKANKDRLADAVNTVKDAAGNTGLEIVKNVKLETVGADKVRVTATNLDVTITADAPCAVSEEGGTTVRAVLLSQIVGALPSGCEVEFASDERNVEQATLVGGEAKFRLATLPVKEFPNMGGVDGVEFELAEQGLRGLLRRTSYAVSTDDTRRCLTAVCLQAKDGVLTAVATDGRRLSTASYPKSDEFVGKDFEMLLPMATVKSLMRLMTGNGVVWVSMRHGSQARFSAAGWTLQTRLVDDSYPNWRQVVPGGEMKSAVVGRADFIEAIRQAATTASSDNTSVAVCVNEGYIGLKSDNGDGTAASSVKFTAKSSGDGAESIFLSPKYLLDALGAFTSDAVSFNYTGPSAAVTFTGEGEGDDRAVAVLMPLRHG